MDNGFAEGYAVGQGNMNGNANGMWGESWLWIIVIFALLGFGNGFGGYGNRGNGIGENYVLATDFANIERKIDGVNNGICDGFYAMNTGMLNGFAGVQNAVMSSGYETRSAIADLGYNMQNCCCQTQRAIGLFQLLCCISCCIYPKKSDNLSLHLDFSLSIMC